MNTLAKVTIGFILAVTAIVIGYDIYADVQGGSIDTISARMRAWAFETPLIPWAWCGLAGHFFGFFKYQQFMSDTISLPLLAVISSLVVCLGIFLRHKGIIIPPWSVAIPAFLTWSLLWAQ